MYYHTTLLEHGTSAARQRVSPIESPINKLELLASEAVWESAKNLERNILRTPISEKLSVDVLLEFSTFSGQLQKDLITQEQLLVGNITP